MSEGGAVTVPGVGSMAVSRQSRRYADAALANETRDVAAAQVG